MLPPEVSIDEPRLGRDPDLVLHRCRRCSRTEPDVERASCARRCDAEAGALLEPEGEQLVQVLALGRDHDVDAGIGAPGDGDRAHVGLQPEVAARRELQVLFDPGLGQGRQGGRETRPAATSSGAREKERVMDPFLLRPRSEPRGARPGIFPSIRSGGSRRFRTPTTGLQASETARLGRAPALERRVRARPCALGDGLVGQLAAVGVDALGQVRCLRDRLLQALAGELAGRSGDVELVSAKVEVRATAPGMLATQ